MSVVAVKIINNEKNIGFEISSDSIMTRNATQSKNNTSDFVKLYEINDIVVGTAGYAEDSSLMKLFIETTKPSSSTETGLLEFISRFQDWKKKKTDNGSINSTFFIGYEYKIFYISGWHIQQITKYDAIGAGQDFALASLYLGHNTKEAVKTAIELSVYCEEPIITIEKYITLGKQYV